MITELNLTGLKEPSGLREVKFSTPKTITMKNKKIIVAGDRGLSGYITSYDAKIYAAKNSKNIL
jgi:hypothetical protein